MRIKQEAFTFFLLCSFLVACSQPSETAVSEVPTPRNSEAQAEEAKGENLEAQETNCPRAGYADIASLEEEQLKLLFEIAKFGLDGKLTRSDFDSNPRYAEIALVGAEFLTTTDKAIRGLVSTTSTPPISKLAAAKLAAKLATIEKSDAYARAGAMGTLKTKIKTCLLMVQTGQP
jgi:hypothetical protein